jgi:isopentenyl diphosphate isomerase/L-lactate dehydrogenase-like FMN-dependent dehydrogenase
MMEGLGEAEGESGLAAHVHALQDDNLTWDDLTWLQSITSLPVVVKGVLRGDDAQLAVEHGAAGIIVSNHGGRQLDTTPAAIDVLPEVVEAVGGQAEILMDGGIRRGTDILKALARGAKAVLIGRPMLWALAYDGENGVRLALDLLVEEFDQAMALSGCRTTDDITEDLLVKS